MTNATNYDLKKNGFIFNIQRYSLHDGPGIRTLVFLKGCPLKCKWCSNPESQQLYPDLAYNANKCIGANQCGMCLDVCAAGAINEGENDRIIIDRDSCKQCFTCVDKCPSKALSIFGTLMGIDDVLKIVEKDSIFYARSEGGLTISGGEPLVQADFAAELLKEAKRRRINTTMETCGYGDWQKLEQMCEHLNLVFFDIKSMHALKHKKFTGVTNELILDNFKKICACFPNLPVTVRTPIIPGFNDTEEDVLAVIDFIKGFPKVKYELLAYHHLGEPKYAYIGREYALNGIRPIENERMAYLTKLIDKLN